MERNIMKWLFGMALMVLSSLALNSPDPILAGRLVDAICLVSLGAGTVLTLWGISEFYKTDG